MIKVNGTVRPFSLHIACAFVNAALEMGLLAPPANELVDLLITVGMEGKHKVNSAHATGGALDIRTKNLPSIDVKYELRDRMKARLGAAYDIILEDIGGPNEHLHAERDPTRGGRT